MPRDIKNDATGWVSTVIQAGEVHGDMHLRSGSPLPIPQQLPPGPAVFVGRERELDLVDAVRAHRVCVITGAPGVGKTALALRWAHEVKAGYPDGQFSLNLRGFDRDSGPVPPASALDDLLRALDIPADRIPPGLDGRAGLFRSLLAHRRALIVLDNARDSEQVRPLLPGGPGCTVLVTGRHSLSGLRVDDGAMSVRLGPLSRSAGIALLRAAAPERAADTSAAGRIVDLCGGLPLALRVVSQRMAATPGARAVAFAEELADEGGRLGELSADDEPVDLRTVFDWSYDVLPPDAAHAFRFLGLHTGSHVDVPTAAAYTGFTARRARRALSVLCAAHLIENTAEDRYEFHDLLRLYAAARMEEESAVEVRRAAVRRAAERYLGTAQAAVRMLRPCRLTVADLPSDVEFRGYDDALAWLDAEHVNIVACARQAARLGVRGVVWQPIAALWAYFDLRKPYEVWTDALRTGLIAAREDHDGLGVGHMLVDLGGVHRDRAEFDEAIRLYRDALDAFGDFGWGVATCLHRLGDAYRDLRQYDAALDHANRALSAWVGIGNRYGQMWTQRNLGLIYRDLHRHDDAMSAFGQARALFEEVGDVRGVASVLRNEGVVLRRMGELVASRERLEQARAIQRAAGDRWNEACTLERLGETLRDLGDADGALTAWRRALLIFTELRDRRTARVGALVAGQYSGE